MDNCEILQVIKEKYPSAVSIEHTMPSLILPDDPRLRVFFFNKEEADWFEKDVDIKIEEMVDYK